MFGPAKAGVVGEVCQGLLDAKRRIRSKGFDAMRGLADFDSQALLGFGFVDDFGCGRGLGAEAVGILLVVPNGLRRKTLELLHCVDQPLVDYDRWRDWRDWRGRWHGFRGCGLGWCGRDRNASRWTRLTRQECCQLVKGAHHAPLQRRHADKDDKHDSPWSEFDHARRMAVRDLSATHR